VKVNRLRGFGAMKNGTKHPEDARLMAWWLRGPPQSLWLLLILCPGAAGALLVVWALLKWVFRGFHLTLD
jgi:hypothetical protein